MYNNYECKCVKILYLPQNITIFLLASPVHAYFKKVKKKLSSFIFKATTPRKQQKRRKKHLYNSIAKSVTYNKSHLKQNKKPLAYTHTLHALIKSGYHFVNSFEMLIVVTNRNCSNIYIYNYICAVYYYFILVGYMCL